MNWRFLRSFPWLDTRARFVANVPRAGKLLDIGSSDGETLNHFAELRPDLQLFATDLFGAPEKYPTGTEFHRGDIQKDRLPWPDSSFDAITCMQLVEHLHDHRLLLHEIGRLLKPSGRVFFETPHPKTLELPSGGGKFTVNFLDDPTHVEVLSPEALKELSESVGLRVTSAGISRNLLFAAAYPLYFFSPSSRKRFTAMTHWLGWSTYLIAQAPG